MTVLPEGFKFIRKTPFSEPNKCEICEKPLLISGEWDGWGDRPLYCDCNPPKL